MNRHWSYDLLVDLVKSQTIDSKRLEDLKEIFKDEIGSNRRFAAITSFRELLEVLEQQGSFDESDISALDEIAQSLSNERLKNAVHNYHPHVSNDKAENQFAIQRNQEEKENQIRLNNLRLQSEKKAETISFQPPLTATSPPKSINFMDEKMYAGNKREKILKEISCGIGRKWRDLGRKLKLREGDLDNLEADYPRDSRERIRKMMELFEEEERIDPKKYPLAICNALSECGRNDMSKLVQEILSR